MNNIEARAILGISSSATIAEARKAHRDLAKIFHPDRHSSGSEEDTRRANQAMAQINQALDVLKDFDKRGTCQSGRNTGSSYSEGFTYARPAHRNECHLCGFQPAGPATFRAYAGALIWVTSRKFEGSFCRLCAQTLFREAQSINLTRGWWGLSIFPMTFALVANIINWVHIRKIGNPSSRDSSVVTPLTYPVPPARPVLLRPTVWIASVVAMLILFVWLGSALAPPQRVTPTTASTVPLPDIPAPNSEEVLRRLLMEKAYDPGSCWTAPDSAGMISPVFCSDVTAEFKVSIVVSDEMDCPNTTSGTVITERTNSRRPGLVACLQSRV